MSHNQDAPHKLLALARRCVAHLEAEAARLQLTVDLLERAAAALLAGDHSQLAQVNEGQQQAESELKTLRDQRLRLRTTIAHELGMPVQQITVRALAARLPQPWNTTLLAHRERVAGLADRVQALTRHNLMFIAQGIDVLHQLVALLTGHEPDPHRYAASGRRLPAAYHSVLEKEC